MGLPVATAYVPPDKPTWAIGPLAGESIGGSVQFWIFERRCIDLGVAYAWWNSSLRLFADYNFHFGIAKHWSFSLGFGPRVSFANGAFASVGPGSSIGLGARLPFGVIWRPAFAPLALAISLSPSLGVLPTWRFVPEAFASVQWVFD